MGKTLPTPVSLSTPYITLGQLLKYASVVDEGSEAKRLIAAGEVKVNGETETRRGRKLRPGDAVEVRGRVFALTAEDEAS